MNNKIIFFDMDGTIADLYGVPNWLENIVQENPSPYKTAKPLKDMGKLRKTLIQLKAKGYKVVVITWLSKNSSRDYDTQVRRAKKEWLKDQGFPCDKIHMVKYGSPKHRIALDYKAKENIIFDDDDTVREKWNRLRGNGFQAYHPDKMFQILKTL